MSGPRSHARAAVLAGALSAIEPLPSDILELRVQPVRRIVDHIAPPLDLTVMQFRYREAEPVVPRHTHFCARRRRH
jgi:hypothetical protein